jgi:hypothetical protein
MPTVRPSFDPIAHVWFFDEQEIAQCKIAPEIAGIEAPSIQELQARLPRAYVIADYRCLITPVIGVITPHMRRQKRPLLAGGFRRLHEGRALLPSTAPEELVPPAPPKRKHVRTGQKRKPTAWTQEQYEKVLDLWVLGMPGNKIAEAVGLPRRTVSSHMIEYARRNGDKRAVRRAGPGGRSQAKTLSPQPAVSPTVPAKAP